MLVEFSLKLLYSTMCRKILKIYGVHISRNWFEAFLFMPPVESGGGNYDLLNQNSVRNDEDDLEH